MSETERHPSAEFNIHADADGNWDDAPKPPEMPAEAGIVEDLRDPAGAISEADVAIPEVDEADGKHRATEAD